MTININQLMPVLPALLGLVVACAVELVTKAAAPAALKRSVAAVLAVLAGVIPTVTLTPGEGPRVYIAAVLSAWVVAVAAHTAGLTTWLQSATPTFGVGPSDPVPADGTGSMGAGAPTPAEQSAEWQQQPDEPSAPPAQPVPAVVVPAPPVPATQAAPPVAVPAPAPPATTGAPGKEGNAHADRQHHRHLGPQVKF